MALNFARQSVTWHHKLAIMKALPGFGREPKPGHAFIIAKLWCQMTDCRAVSNVKLDKMFLWYGREGQLVPGHNAGLWSLWKKKNHVSFLVSQFLPKLKLSVVAYTLISPQHIYLHSVSFSRLASAPQRSQQSSEKIHFNNLK